MGKAVEAAVAELLNDEEDEQSTIDEDVYLEVLGSYAIGGSSGRGGPALPPPPPQHCVDRLWDATTAEVQLALPAYSVNGRWQVTNNLDDRSTPRLATMRCVVGHSLTVECARHHFP